MRSMYAPKIFLSVESEGIDNRERGLRHRSFNMVLDKLKIKHLMVTGKYNGTQETSYIIADNEQNRKIAMQAMEFYKQECILLLDNEGFGNLLYPDNTEKRIGAMKVKTIKPQGDYTYLSDSQEYVTFE